MASAALDALVAEAKALRDKWLPILEGWRDYARLNMQPESIRLAQRAIEGYQAAINAIDQVPSMAIQLEQSGYPDGPTIEIPANVREDMLEQLRTLNAALGTTGQIPEVVSAEITPGALENIPTA